MLVQEAVSSPARLILVVLAGALVIATALPLVRLDHWSIRVFDFPRVQITVAGVSVIALYFCFSGTPRIYQLVILGLLVISAGYQAAKILPYTVLMPRQVLASESGSNDAGIRLLVANVLMENRESEAFLNIVREYDPDVVLTMETDMWWEAALRTLEKEYPHTLSEPLDNTYGMLVHSRLEMIDAEIRFILNEDIPSMHMQVRLPSGHRVFLHFVHPHPPNPKYSTETTERDAELLIVGREVKERNKPTIIAGDFNDVPWSTTTRLFQKASGLLDPRVGRGMYNTFGAGNILLRWPLDHIFHSDHFRLVRMERGPAWGSDHFPLFIELSLESGAGPRQEAPEMSPAEGERVDEKIDDGRQSRIDMPANPYIAPDTVWFTPRALVVTPARDARSPRA